MDEEESGGEDDDESEEYLQGSEGEQLRSKENQITADAKSEEEDGIRPQKKQRCQRKLVKDKVGTQIELVGITKMETVRYCFQISKYY